ncbi:MAG TPA: hypothetical protein VHY84_10860 [Bryobacteraceae bacterium]|nr:hypothetical protein [Bryobacteraceae bacterium]
MRIARDPAKDAHSKGTDDKPGIPGKSNVNTSNRARTLSGSRAPTDLTD